MIKKEKAKTGKRIPCNQHQEIILEARRQTLKEVERMVRQGEERTGSNLWLSKEIKHLMRYMRKKGITDDQFNME